MIALGVGNGCKINNAIANFPIISRIGGTYHQHRCYNYIINNGINHFFHSLEGLAINVGCRRRHGTVIIVIGNFYIGVIYCFFNKIEYIIGDAMQIVPQLDEQFDLVFIDADKKNYCNYYDLVFDKVKPGGYILADNVLWSGKVVEDYEALDSETKIIMDYNKMVHEDPRVQEILLPIRDGLMLARKR